jgi:hypothetical protein
MARLVRHRQTKGAATDRPILPPPRHIPTLPGTVGMAATEARRGTATPGLQGTVLAACCAAVPGTTVRGTCAPPFAAVTPPGTASTSTDSVLPGRSRETEAYLLNLYLFTSWGEVRQGRLAGFRDPGRCGEGQTKSIGKGSVPFSHAFLIDNALKGSDPFSIIVDAGTRS